MMLLLGTAMFAVFFFLTIYVQTVWGYSPVKAGVAWLPFPISLIALNVFVARVLVTKVGVRPLLMAGPLFAGAASSLLNIGQQVGGSIGLAAIGTVAWTSVAHSVRDQMTAAAAASGGS